MARTVVVTPRTQHPAWRNPNTALILAGAVEVGLQTPGLGTATAGLATTGTVKKVAPVGGRTSLGVTAWASSTRRVAQAGRATIGLFATSEPSFTVSTGAFTHITVTRDYDLADGSAPTGIVYFTPTEWLLNNGVTLVAAPVGAALDVDGRISISLAANTDFGTTPVNSKYVVREVITGQPERAYTVQVPHNAGPTVDLATLPTT